MIRLYFFTYQAFMFLTTITPCQAIVEIVYTFQNCWGACEHDYYQGK